MTLPAITAKGENYDPLNIKLKYRQNNNGRLGIIHLPHPAYRHQGLSGRLTARCTAGRHGPYGRAQKESRHAIRHAYLKDI